jgi:UPF0755 protein
MSRSRGGLHRWLAVLGLMVVAGVLIVTGVAGYWYLGPYSNFQDQTFVEVEHGMSSRAIAEELANHGVIRSKWAFLAVRLMHPFAALQAGEYRFATAQNPFQVFNKIRRGDIFYEDFTVPEGSNIFDIARLLAAGDTVTPDAFLKAAADPTIVRDIDAREIFR